MRFKVYFDLYPVPRLPKIESLRTRMKDSENTVYARHFAGIDRCMSQAELIEQQLGEKFDMVVKLREDAYAVEEWRLTAEYSKGITALDCLGWGGISDITYVLGGNMPPNSCTAFLGFGFSPKIWPSFPRDRYQKNSEGWLAALVSFFRIPKRFVTLCEMPVFASRWREKGLAIKMMHVEVVWTSTWGPPTTEDGNLVVSSMNPETGSSKKITIHRHNDTTNCKPKWISKILEMPGMDEAYGQMYRKDDW
eukprot:CAMPEP_0174266620 /NCGR_PEP_ID=MMETSP0439-20130205/30885_1 /TAXON_ID=0 /ORGANISM="Stereomyxa ramosa, Strain Chinc5" /LENGTH=249 /DNA_ID=CAMNT_0015353693 /DNA_START=239 /DNA_END=986 /DNA_ORIENTATION=-